MSEQPKHTKIRTFTPQPNGEMIIETDSYHEKKSGYKKEIVKHINTNSANLLSDVVGCLGVLKGPDASQELIITIMSRDGCPHLITKQWTVEKESFGRR